MLLDVSVAKRLGGGIGIVVVTFVALIIFVMSAFKQEHETTDLILSNYVPATSTLYSADRDLQQALVAERSMHATDPASKDFASLMSGQARHLQQLMAFFKVETDNDDEDQDGAGKRDDKVA